MPYTPYQPTWNNPYMPQPMQQMPQVAPQQFTPQYQPPMSAIIKVNGRESALQYQMQPNTQSPALFDMNGKQFYIVTADGAGTKTVEVFDFTKHVDEQPVQIDGAQFVSRREFDEFAAKVNAVIGAANGIHGPVQATTNTDAAAAGGNTAAEGATARQ